MKRTWYIGLAVIVGVSILVVAALPVEGMVQLAFALPGVGALFTALYQLARDKISHDRSLYILEAKNSFALGASSHMANVAFDKHVLFCEEYVQEMFSALDTLFREGPTRDALTHSSALYRIQRKYAVWLTPKLEQELDKFEAAIRRIGATADLVYENPGTDGRSVKIEEMYALFSEVIGEHDQREGITEDVAVTAVIAKLRKVLGTEELTELRGRLVQSALRHL
ncbi:MAG: hypothetical protein L3J98_10515 [Gammaproteobacteria bacterium]|nr:hypothetical protein [Gammaproteobacteria bacterium]MCF6260570.1 hypothetical protein [Gammaproteobacteria bacterium]